MKIIPVDASKIRIIATGKGVARAEYAPDVSGQNRRTGNQETNEHGVPVWVIDCFIDDPEADRAELAPVRVASPDEPVTKFGEELRFTNLRVRPWADAGGNFAKVAFSWLADGIEGQGGKGQHKGAEQHQPAA